MNGGIEMLMARMDTHPEEFTAEVMYGASKWSDLVQQWKHCIPKEDMEAFETKLKEVHAQHFTELVMEELVDPKSGKSLWGDSSLAGTQQAGQTHAQSMAMQQAYLAQQQAAILQAQAAQQQTSSYTSLGGSAQGYLSALFGGKK